MLKEYSYGAIIYKLENGSPLFLLVHSKRSGRWGFPKGHTEDGETELETAKREIFEETGIKQLKFYEGFKKEDIYIIDGTIPSTKGRIAEKHSVYFLAEALEEPARCDENEIAEIKWLDLKASLEKLSFINQKKMIKLAYKKIITPGGHNV